MPERHPLLEAKPRAPVDYVLLTPLTLTGSGLSFIAVPGGLGWGWWTHGRDHRYKSLHYLTDDPREEALPLLAHDPIVIEYQPPEGLRPGEMGALLDQRVDLLDATSTIVDLAARGYLTIERVEPGNPIARLITPTDWELASTAKNAGDLVAYETILYQGIFDSRSRVRLSQLKDHFRATLRRAEDRLYARAAEAKWFVTRPDRARGS